MTNYKQEPRRNPITVIFEGKERTGSYYVTPGKMPMVHAECAGASKAATQGALPADVLAELLINELLTEAKRHGR